MNTALLFFLTIGGAGVIGVFSAVGGAMYYTFKEELQKQEQLLTLPKVTYTEDKDDRRGRDHRRSDDCIDANDNSGGTSTNVSVLTDSGYVLVTGSMGGGKTTALAALALIRHCRGHRIVMFTPHVEYGTWQIADEVYGYGATAEKKGENLSEGVSKYFEVIEQRYHELETKPKSELNHQPITLLFDEYGEYADLLGSNLCRELAHKVGASIRKVNVYVVVSTQNHTKEFLGNVPGVHALMVKRAVHLQLQSQASSSSVGGFKPTGTGLLSVMGREAYELGTIALTEVLPDVKNPQDFGWLMKLRG